MLARTDVHTAPKKGWSQALDETEWENRLIDKYMNTGHVILSRASRIITN